MIDDTYKELDFEPDVVDDEDEEEIQEYNYPDHEHLNPTEIEETNKNIVDEPTVIDPDPTEKIIEAQPSTDNVIFQMLLFKHPCLQLTMEERKS